MHYAECVAVGQTIEMVFWLCGSMYWSKKCSKFV